MTRANQPQQDPDRDPDRRPLSGREARRRWAAEVTQALTEQRLSINSAAKAIGISPGRLQAWLSQDVEPSPRVMADLARVIGRGHLHLLQLLDWLPADLADIPLRLEATARLNDAMADARRWLQAATQAAGLRGGSLIAGALLAASDQWQATIRNTVRGDRYPARYETLVSLSPVAPAGGSADTAGDRARVEELIATVLNQTSARWLPHNQLTGQRWAVRRDLVLSVPSLCASRPAGLRPNLLVPPSVAVIGVPRTGAPEVAALVADLLDWAYLDAGRLAEEQFGLPRGAASELAQETIAGRLLTDPAGAFRQTVWSFTEPGPILHTIREIGGELPLVILLRAPDSLLTALSEEHQGAVAHRDAAETAQNVVRRTLQAMRTERTYRILDVPDTVAGSGAEQLDAVFDAYVELAFDAANWLHEHHAAPSLHEAHGLLGTLWRRRHD
ncbi:MAG: helix-turn-helix transcriptional regulator [Micromonosporaceae bacterium]|nr:helix-turn-helix transcriptional regulator [Micromonosporaceae bacterium]